MGSRCVARTLTAHLLALRLLEADGASAIYNLGNGTGYSVTEVINAARRVTGHSIPVRDDPRRAGDPPVLVADAERARAELGWQPQFPDIETMISHAWQWEQKSLHAFRARCKNDGMVVGGPAPTPRTV